VIIVRIALHFLSFILLICVVNVCAWELQQDLTCKNSVAIRLSAHHFCIPSDYRVERINKDGITLSGSKYNAVIYLHSSGYNIKEKRSKNWNFLKSFNLHSHNINVRRTNMDPEFFVYSWEVEILHNELYLVIDSPKESELSELVNEILNSKKTNMPATLK
jgi:hypothetical protein